MSSSTGAAAGERAALRGDPVVRRVFAGLPARYDRLAYLLSFGQDRRWRGAVVDRVAAGAPRRVLDVATGPAGIALAVARRTGAQVAGVDLNEPMLRAGAANVRKAGRSGQLALALGHADRLPFGDGTFDAVTFSYLLRYVDDPAATVAELARCLRPGGTLASLDFHLPQNAWWRGWWQLYTRVALPVLGGLTGGPAWARVGQFLGPSISTHYRQHPLAEHVAAWQAAGLDDVQVRLMSLGGGLVMSGTKRAAPDGPAPDEPGPGEAG
ncbi:MAG TPA: class I SAM-dependent methyltransferase [Streptosporangiaceae bacterium]|jgi:demethylmenaquinone methyltransferase/2-methoxy-6-polyprenyl-1,4-benzoquinol methylase|nr:class I SAM-dependent methyltransferase [Streptosporangiaceae bacterium]